MKKLLLMALVAVFGMLNVNAQTEKGKIVLSGATSLQFISSNIEYEYDGQSGGDVTQNTFSIMPSIGYFVMDNLAVGLSANFTSTTQKDSGAKYSIKSTMLVPTALYYFSVPGDLKPLVQVGVGLMSTSEEYDDPDYDYHEEDKFSGLALNFGGGASYFINETVSLNFGISYTSAKLKNSDDSEWVQKQGNVAGNVGFSVFF